MKWLYKLEFRYRRYAIADLMKYIVILNATVFFINYLIPNTNLFQKLMLYPDRVLKGEVWRLISFLFVPDQLSPIWILFSLYFYYIVGSNLENQWGSFRFNIYYLIGVLATIAAAFIAYAISPVVAGVKLYIPITTMHLNLSLFLAFAHLYPNFEILIFFLIPVKVKYLAWFNWALIVFSLIFNPVTLKLAALASVLNYFIFFGKDIITMIKTKKLVYKNRKRFKQAYRK